MLDDGAGGAYLRRGVEALSSFKKKVDAVLDTLDASPANANQVESLTLTRESLAGGSAFGEAVGLYAQYAQAHARIATLSRTLGLQIEALQIAVHGADVGFDNLEEDARRRFHDIRIDLQREQQLEQDLATNTKKRVEGGF